MRKYSLIWLLAIAGWAVKPGTVHAKGTDCNFEESDKIVAEKIFQICKEFTKIQTGTYKVMTPGAYCDLLIKKRLRNSYNYLKETEGNAFALAVDVSAYFNANVFQCYLDPEEVTGSDFILFPSRLLFNKKKSQALFYFGIFNLHTKQYGGIWTSWNISTENIPEFVHRIAENAIAFPEEMKI